MWQKIKPYAISILIPLAVGGLAAFLTRDSMDIYAEIVKPPLAPPGILFPIVWTLLYILMGVSAAMVYTADAPDPQKERALSVYAISLVLNFTWSIIFFRFRVYLFAFVWLLALLFSIVKTIRLYRPISAPAAYLQIPYALWVAFAGYLNFAIYLLN